MDNYPEVEIDTAVLEGPFVDYLAEHAASIQLVMVGAAQTGEVQSCSALLERWACVTVISPCSSSVFNVNENVDTN